MNPSDIKQYFDDLLTQHRTGQAREHAYRPALKALLEAVEDGLIAVNDPKRIDVGAPDFIVLRGEIPIGFVEAKDIDTDLDRIERTEQMDRYRGALNNLILTNYLEFRWYVEGKHRETAALGALSDGKLKRVKGGEEAVAAMLRRFVLQVTSTIGSPRDLAERMARITHEIKLLIEQTLASETRGEELHQQLISFRATLIPDLNEAQFADMYAQTLAYGLFAARVRWDGKGVFDRQQAAWNIPPTNPFLQELFNSIAGPRLDERVSWLVESLADLLARADMDAILENFGQVTRQEDPIVHFYETFLVAYDPALRERRGVYYTPEPVVSYIVRSVDKLLKKRFGKPDGLADARALILDPATGTGTFLYFVTQHIYDSLREQGQLGGWDGYVTQRLLPRVFGFELLMAPYAVAHMKLGIQLHELGYEFSRDQRLGVYLTNSLTEAASLSDRLPGFGWFIAKEANEASHIKQDKEIMVVLGNPPYSGHSANRSETEREETRGNRTVRVKEKTFIGKLLQDYYQVDGARLQERNPKWLQDDYVKFIRFGQWRIERTGEGVLAFVTNHGYLDNPTFRGMRQQLMNAFDEIYVLNLHGNAKKRERAPDGGPDENVFDIQQGVAIGIFVKKRDKKGPARVYHADLWGDRAGKYGTLYADDVLATDWREIQPDAPFYLFIPQDTDLREEYRQMWQITEAMPVNNMGITTGNDDELVAFGDDELKARGFDLSLVADVAYRPFDNRRLFYEPEALARARYTFMKHFREGENLAVNTLRRPRNDRFGNFFITARITDKCIISSLDNAQVFPLYLYPEDGELINGSPWPPGKDERRPNLAPAFVRDIEARLGLTFVPDGRGDLQETFGPEDVLHYIYAIFHSPTYRARYEEFLRIDFPRVPLTGDKMLFADLAAFGEQLIALHLLDRQKAPALNRLTTSFPIKGDNEVASGYPKYSEPTGDTPGRVYVNKKQYFEGIEPEGWEFYVGGYQVLDKWLKDRKGRQLSWNDLQHYQRVVIALRETMRLMDEIDERIPGWPIE
ncbi:MAG: N-6 DNA methylase [Anaerolineae bacterium]|nr:N-6 DNA methylase [Anaerolineae bacterium]